MVANDEAIPRLTTATGEAAGGHRSAIPVIFRFVLCFTAGAAAFPWDAQEAMRMALSPKLSGALLPPPQLIGICQ